MKKRIKKTHVDYGFGFPVKLLNVPVVNIRGTWTPAINYNLLSAVVLGELCRKGGRLTGNELRFIRHSFGMTLQEFGMRFHVTHPGVLKWEKMKNRSTGMNWATEKDIRLSIQLKLNSRSRDLLQLYTLLEKVADSPQTIEIRVDQYKLAA